MILKRFNPDASPDNALQITEKDGICCGACPRILSQYALQREGGNDVDEMYIDGTLFTFAEISPENTDALAAKIEEILHSLGYTTKGVSVVWLPGEGGLLQVSTDYSEATFEELGGTDFSVIGHSIVGVFHPPAGCCGAGAIMTVLQDEEEADEFLQFTITSIQPVTDVTASDGEDPVELVKTGHNTWTVDIADSGLFDEQTITITVSSLGCPDQEFTFEYTFPEEEGGG